MRTYFKMLRRMIKNHLTRFLTLCAIIALGVGFITGLGASAPNMRDTADKFFDDNAVPDIIIKSSSPQGLTQQQQTTFSQQPFVDEALAFFCFDTTVGEMNARIYYLPLLDMRVNKIDIIDRKTDGLPENENQILVERKSNGLKKYAAGDIIEYEGRQLEITGISANPLYFSKQKDQVNNGDEEQHIEVIMYFDSAFYSPPVSTDMYIKVAGASSLKAYSGQYKKLIKESIESLKAVDGEGMTVFLTLEENASAAFFWINADKLEVISYIFPIFFIAVVILVVLTTMTRLIDEERLIIGGYRTLGYSAGKIVFKYIFYVTACCIIGSIIGMALGMTVLPPLIFSAFGALFRLPKAVGGFYLTFGLVCAFIMIVTVLIVTVILTYFTLKEKPAALLRHKSPKAGKKIFLEKIGIIWKRLSFKYKSTFRNIFRYVKHFVMTITSVAGCTALMFAGLGLYDTTKVNAADLVKTITYIAILLIVCAGLLSVLVLYSLTNILVEERKREIATLKVLGYKNGEVNGYIFREVFILAIIGILVGLPLGFLILGSLFSFMDYGALADIRWYSWFITFGLSVLFAAVSDLLLYRKITGVDMNASLKTID